MRVDADDFGCVPDGRILDPVRTAAGSAVLTAPRGGLREGDAGKRIAIPGAVELRARIVGLVERREVRDAVIRLDQPDRLTGRLVDPRDETQEPFRADQHVRRRITVADAAPGGRVLVTDVAEVLNATTIRLADAAAVAVNGAEVILNDRFVVQLDNYARRAVAGLTVDLGDRTIDDGEMALGARGLRSSSAAFSSEDLETRVTIAAAGLLVTTLQSVESATSATLAVPAQHALTDDDGAIAHVWRTDSRPRLELLLAAIREPGAEATEIRFNPGVYDFSRPPPVPGGPQAAIGLNRLADVTLRGAGEGVTVLRVMPGQRLMTDSFAIQVEGSRRLTLRDLTVDGSYLTLENADEQVHGILVSNGSEEVALRHVGVFRSAGDGIRLLGRAGALAVRKVWIDGCRLIQNKRSGICFQRGVASVLMRGCYVEMTGPSTDQCIDFEPSGLGQQIVAPRDVLVEGNVLVHAPRGDAVAIEGVSGADPTRRVVFAGNVLSGGGIVCSDVAQLTIRDNVVVVPQKPLPGVVVINLKRGGDTVQIEDNVLVSEQLETVGAIHVSGSGNRPVRRARVAGNLCVTRAGNGIQVTSSDDVAVDGNMLVATGACRNAVRLHSETLEMNGVTVQGNHVTVAGTGSWAAGVMFQATRPMHQVSAVGNGFQGAATGITFAGIFTEEPLCAMNRHGPGVQRPFAGLEDLPHDAVVVGGGAGRGGTTPGSGAGRFLAGLGDPNESGLRGNVGDLYQRLDRDPENPAALYVKESGDGPGGWAPK